MILTPTTAPPQLRADALDPTPTTTPQKAALAQPLKLPAINSYPHDENSREYEQVEQPGLLERLKVPTVVLESQTISHKMAAALSVSLLGHTLFLKNQVPFPVAQLSRMPGGKSNPKVAKKRDELLATFDTLACHLCTTFVALSTAYAQRNSPKAEPPTVDYQNAHRSASPISVGPARRGSAHLMFVIGSSVGAARARVLLTIDGLEVKVWGAQALDEEGYTESESEDDTDSDGSEESEEEESEAESDKESVVDSDEEESDEESCATEDEESEDDESDVASSESGSLPPPSRSPSPSTPPARSLAPSPESVASPHVTPQCLPTASAFTFTAPLPPSKPAVDATSISAPPQILREQPVRRTPRTSASRETTPALSHAQEQQALRAAERLLSRTLMNAWSEGEGDMSNELPPTQTHIYLRAPRRFVHPAWAARQNLNRSLDGVLGTFLEDAGAVPAPAKGGKTKARGVRTEGAWVGCKGGSAFAEKAKEEEKEKENSGENDGRDSEENEEDEEIWWVWEGKLVGFADW